MDLFELLGTISIDGSGAKKALDDTAAQGQQTQSKLSSAFSSIGRGAVAVGKTIATGMLVAGGAVGGLAIKALDASGNLEQNMGGSEAVFKESAARMQETAKNAFSQMGLSTNDFLSTANKMGALFQGAGFDIEESADLSASAMQRAADVASIMGIDTASAMEAITGAAKGNFDMMDNLGVAMNDTTLQAYALEKGIDKTTQEMTNQEKVGLAMEMFMEKTAYAAGNYARENETLAGSLGTAKAALNNFLDGSGDVDQLVTAFSGAADVIVRNVQELAPRLVSGLTDIVNQVIPMIPPLLNQLLPSIIEGAVGLINGLVGALPGILSALMGALPAVIEGIQSIFTAVVTALPQIVQSLVSALPTLIPMLVDALVNMIVLLCTMLPQIIQPIIDYLPQIIVAIVDALMQNLPALIQGAVQLVVGIVQAIPQIMMSLINAIPTIFDSLVQGIMTSAPILWDGIVEIATTYWTELTSFYKELFATISEWLAPIIETVTNWFSQMWAKVAKWGSDIWNNIKNWFNGIKNTISGVMDTISRTISNIWNGIKNGISNAVNAVKTTVSNVFNGVKNTVSNIFNGIKNTATNVWNGIKSAIQNPIEKARDLVSTAIEKIKGFFNFNIKWPKIPMPHFGISPSGWKIGDLLKGSIPKLKIDFYAEGGVMKRPTLFDYDPNTGTAKVGGEAGAEAVAPIDTLQAYIRAAVQAENAEVTQRLERIIDLLVQFFPNVLAAMDQTMVLDTGVLVAQTAPAMDAELGKIAIKKGRGR